MSTYLVTGGAGFIGSHLVDRLVSLGVQVRVLDDFSTGSIENIRHHLNEIELISGTIENPATVRDAVKGVDYVLHHAAVASVPRSIDDPVACNAVNVTGTLNLLLASKEAGVRRVVFASSSAVYGDNPALPKTEDMPLDLLSPYALSKLAGENYCHLFCRLYGLETVSLRYFNVFGPRQNPMSEYSAVIPKFLTIMLEDRQPTVYGDGQQSRDFTYVEDIVSANLLASQRQGLGGQVFNIACGKSFSLLDLVDHLNRVLKRSIAPVHASARPGDVKHSVADIKKARHVLGYEPTISFEEGLRRLADYWIGENA